MCLAKQREGQLAREKHGGRGLVPGTVFMIAQQGISTACKLHADLMAAACMQANTHKGWVGIGLPHKLQPCFFDTLAFPLDNKYFIFTAVFKQEVFPVSGLGRCSVDKRHIFLDHGIFLDRFAQGGGSGFGSGIDHHTAYILIKTVNREEGAACSFR